MGGGASLDRRDYGELEKKALLKRRKVAAVIIFGLIPLTGFLGYKVVGNNYSLILSLIILILTTLPFFMVFEQRKPKGREIVLIAMMTAITVFSHTLFHATVPLTIGTAMVIISGASMGSEAGFLVGALSRFICNFYMGQGPWTPWQMFCWGLLGFIAGMTFAKEDVENTFENLRNNKKKKKEIKTLIGPVVGVVFGLLTAYVSFLIYPGKDNTFLGWRVYAFGGLGLIIGTIFMKKKMEINSITLTVFTFLVTIILYGGIMNFAAMIMSSNIPGMEISLKTLRTLYISGLSYDFGHASMAAICMFFIGKPMIAKIERIKVKYGIYR